MMCRILSQHVHNRANDKEKAAAMRKHVCRKWQLRYERWQQSRKYEYITEHSPPVVAVMWKARGLTESFNAWGPWMDMSGSACQTLRHFHQPYRRFSQTKHPLMTNESFFSVAISEMESGIYRQLRWNFAVLCIRLKVLTMISNQRLTQFKQHFLS